MLCSRVSELAILRAEDALSVPAASYELPDGQEVKLQGERVMVPEVRGGWGGSEGGRGGGGSEGGSGGGSGGGSDSTC